jgi:hypothetical protein
MADFLNRYVGIVKESSYGTDPGSGYFYGEVDEESLGHKFDLMVREDMSRAISSKAVTGKEYSEGDISLAMQVDDFVATCLLGFFPNDSGVSGSGPYTHTLLEPASSSDAYPSYTMKIGREEKEHTFTGLCANTLNVAANVGEYVMMSVGFYGKGESAVASLSTPTYDGAALDALYFANGEVSFGTGSAVATIKSFSFDINLNQDPDNAYALGGAGPQRKIPKQRREITGTIEFNQVLYTATDGEPTYSTLTAADGDVDNPSGSDAAMTLTLKDEGGTESITFDFKKVFFEAPEASVSGRDTNTMTVNFTGLYDDTTAGAAKSMTCVLVGNNLQATTY